MKSIFLSGAAVIALSGLSAAPALAQGGDAATSGRDTITVTARRREENLQDVPVSVTAIGAETLQEQGVTSIREVAQRIPGLTFQESFGRRDDRPGLRGLTSIGDPSFGVESGVSIFVDGVYIAGDSSTFGLRDVERIEVVRGPQSALYGRNAYAGAINFVTAKPSDELGGTITGRAARYGEYEGSALVGGKIAEGLSGTLYGRFYTYDGEYTNSFDGSTDVGDEQTWSVAGSLFFEPSDRVSFRTRVAYAEDDDGHIPFTMELANTSFNPASPGIGPFAGDDYFVGELPGAVNNIVGPLNEDLLFQSGMERQTLIATGRADIELGSGFMGTILGGYYSEDRLTGSDSAPLGTLSSGLSLFALGDQDLSSYSIEARIDSPQDNRIRATVGGFYFSEDRNNIGYSYDNAGAFTPVVRPPSIEAGVALAGTADPSALDVGETLRETDNWAVFGSIAIDIMEQLTLTGEGRYSEDKKTVGPTQPDQRTFTSFNPRVILEYHASDDVLVYGSVAKGNKPGGFNNANNRDTIPIINLVGGERLPSFVEEEAWTYEIGAKTSFFDNRFTANATVYRSEVDNAQLTQTYAWLTSAFSFPTGANIINIPEVTIMGAELEMAYQLNDNVDFTFGYAYVDSEIRSGTSRDYGRLFAPFNGQNTLGENSIAGQKFPRISPHQLNAATSINVPMSWGEGFLNVNGSYESSRFVQTANLASVPEAFLLNARAGVRLDGGIEVAVFGRNILNEEAPVDALRFRDGDFRRAFQIANRKGATFGGEIIFNF